MVGSARASKWLTFAWLSVAWLAFAAACSPSQPPDRVLLISVDTLRADHLGCYGGAQGLTPRLDGLAAQGVRFANAYAPAPFTLASVAALLTGRRPGELGIRDNLTALPDDLPSLATRLGQYGWVTGAVVSSLVLKIARPLHRGFDVFDAELPRKELVRWWVAERGAAATTDAALALLDQLHASGPGPTLLWVHFQDPHGPYTPPDGLRERYLSRARGEPDGRRELPLTSASGAGGLPRYQYVPPHSDVAWYRAGYAAEIRHTDEEIGRLLDAVATRPGWFDAVVVLTADHGEGLGEDDHWFAHGARLTEGALRVPLLIRAPGLAPGAREDRASLLDVAPTLISLLGLPPDPAHRGRDLFAPDAATLESTVLVSASEKEAGGPRFGILSGGYKLIRVATPEGGEERLFQLPDEDLDRSEAFPDLARRLAGQLDAGLSSMSASATRRTLSEEETEGLRALGYLEAEPDESASAQ